MRKHLMTVAAIVAMLVCASAAHAQLAYSFEAPPVNPDGFGPNGGGVTVTQSNIGVTHGVSSLKTSVVAGATFVGALTGVVNPLIGDPPGVHHVLLDMTLQQSDTYAGAGFALVGVTVFGATQPDFPGGQQFGLQAQFADFEHIGGKAPGLYKDVQIDLTSATHPVTFAGGQSFNQIFGTVGSGPNDLIPTGFQLFFNKTGDSAMSVYIDNIRVFSQIPEPATFALLGLGAVVLTGIRRRSR